MYGDVGTTIFWQIFMLDLIIIRGDRLTSVRSWNFFNFKKTVLAKKSSNIGSIDINVYFNTNKLSKLPQSREL